MAQALAPIAAVRGLVWLSDTPWRAQRSVLRMDRTDFRTCVGEGGDQIRVVLYVICPQCCVSSVLREQLCEALLAQEAIPCRSCEE